MQPAAAAPGGAAAPALSLAAVLRYLDPVATSTDFFLGHLPYLDEASRSLSTPRRYLSLGIAALLLSFVLFALTAMLLCTAVAVLYPAYQTMKALESRPLQVDCMVQWLTYWVCYALFSIVELFGDHLLYCAWRQRAVPTPPLLGALTSRAPRSLALLSLPPLSLCPQGFPFTTSSRWPF
jgi:hypothetical protein